MTLSDPRSPAPRRRGFVSNRMLGLLFTAFAAFALFLVGGPGEFRWSSEPITASSESPPYVASALPTPTGGRWDATNRELRPASSERTAPAPPSVAMPVMAEGGRAVSLLPHEDHGAAGLLMLALGRDQWPLLGDAGWGKPSRLARESMASCPSLLAYVERRHADAQKRFEDFKATPKYKMPWFYYNPEPACGAVALRHYSGGPYHVFALRPPRYAPAATNGGPDYASLLLERAKQTQGVGRNDSLLRGGGSDEGSETLHAFVGSEFTLSIEDCGLCGLGGGNSRGNESVCDHDVLLVARLVGYNAFLQASVERDPTSSRRTVRFRPAYPGLYALEVKQSHYRGDSVDSTHPRSLGVIGQRGALGNQKAFFYNDVCDEQRHVFGSPFRVVVAVKGDRSTSGGAVSMDPILSTPFNAPVKPFCTSADHTEGAWLRIHDGDCRPDMNSGRPTPHCHGNPTWLTDAGGYNDNYLWAPATCRYALFSPPHGPGGTCLTVPRKTGRVTFFFVGDSVMREYGKSAMLFDLRPAQLYPVYINIKLEGKYYSRNYARDVAGPIVHNIKDTNAGVFVTNLGMMHMIGTCSTAQWREFVELFVAAWSGPNGVAWHPSAHGGRMQNATVLSREVAQGQPLRGYKKGETVSNLERAVWVSPPTIHYARLGMSTQRARQWDDVAWGLLEPLGFERVRADVPTAVRQEGTWDGLHYAAEKNRPQTRWRNKAVAPHTWNGGVANMLFLMVLHLVCYGGPQATR